jgi:apolipoprotein N-acyltransferase
MTKFSSPSPQGLRLWLFTWQDWCQRRHGASRALCAFLAGLLAVLALPPVGAAPLLWVIFPSLLWGLAGCRNRWQGFWLGWWFGFGYFTLGFYWITFALLTDLHAYWMFLPLTISLLPAWMAVFYGAVFALLQPLRPGVRQLLVLISLWALAEWLRGTLLTGFSWNMLAQVWDRFPALTQGVALLGGYGWSGVSVGLFAWPALWGKMPITPLAPSLAQPHLAPQTNPQSPSAQDSRHPYRLLFAGLFCLVSFYGWGSWRLAHFPTQFWPDLWLRLVQADIPQSEKWQKDALARDLARYIALSKQPAPQNKPRPAFTLWPETAVIGLLEEDEKLRQLLAQEIIPPQGALLTGTIRRQPAPPTNQSTDTATDTQSADYYNSLLAIGPQGQILARYDKHHLVPFGEFIPWRQWLPLEAIAGNRASFATGPGPQNLTLPPSYSLPVFSPLICYEAIFPGSARPPDHRALWLYNLTNDGWFGHTAGPYQHFALTRLRAIEEGIPLVRVANAGISGVIDPVGRIVASQPLGTFGILDVPLPRPLIKPPPFALFGNGPIMGMFFFLCLLGFWRAPRYTR